MLSPTYKKESISLYIDYIVFLKSKIEKCNDYKEKSKILLKDGFKGFVSNRFRSIGELSALFIYHHGMIDVFFEKLVDIHAYKLVLATSSYQKSKWFIMCCKIACFFDKSLTVPIKKQLALMNLMTSMWNTKVGNELKRNLR